MTSRLSAVPVTGTPSCHRDIDILPTDSVSVLDRGGEDVGNAVKDGTLTLDESLEGSGAWDWDSDGCSGNTEWWPWVFTGEIGSALSELSWVACGQSSSGIVEVAKAWLLSPPLQVVVAALVVVAARP